MKLALAIICLWGAAALCQAEETPTATPTPVAGDPQELLEKARAEEDIAVARELYSQAGRLDSGGATGITAVFELGRMEYAMGNLEAALGLFESVDAGKGPENLKPEILFWTAQARMSLNGILKASGEFRQFTKAYPRHALADAAALGAADCDRALKKYDAALAAYRALWEKPLCDAAAHAMWQAASIYSRQGKAAEASELYGRLVREYPDSFEGRQALIKWRNIPAADTAEMKPAPPEESGGSKGKYTIQVGAFTRQNVAWKLVKKLKKNRYSVRIEKKVIHDSVFHVVKIGSFSSRKKAADFAEKVARREKLPTRVVEE